jgi:hypothetical protein
MKKRSTYRSSTEGNFLIRTEEFNSNLKLIKDCTFDRGTRISETVYTYDKSGNLTSEIQTNDDGITATYYEFDRENKIIGYRQLFNDEVYEEVRFHYDNKHTTVDTFQDDELVSKLIKTENDDNVSASELYGLDGKLSERYSKRYFESTNTFETEVFNEDNKLSSKIIEKLDEKHRPKEVIYLNEENKLFKLQQFVYSNDKLAEILTKDYYANIKETICRNEYDSYGRLIDQKLYTPAEEIIQKCSFVYNENGDIVEESSLYTGGYTTAAGILNNGQSYHYIFDIEY